MYEALDSFLRIGTWHTREAPDQERFFCALKTIINRPGFHPEEMGAYMKRKLEQQGYPEDHAFHDVRLRYVHDAWAVKRYLEANC